MRKDKAKVLDEQWDDERVASFLVQKERERRAGEKGRNIELARKKKEALLVMGRGINREWKYLRVIVVIMVMVMAVVVKFIARKKKKS